MKTNFIVMAIDASDSMSNIRQKTEDAFRNMLRTLREQAARYNQKTYVKVTSFGDCVNTIVDWVDVSEINDKPFSYRVNGMTSLFDAVGDGVEQIRSLRHKTPAIFLTDSANLLLVYTDGGENASRRFSAQSIKNLIADCEKSGDWTLTFQLPPGGVKYFSDRFGLPLENLCEWEATAQGVREATERTSTSITRYFDDRAKGVKATRSFYSPVVTDMSKVSVAKVKKKLDDLSNCFKSYSVDKESVVKEFTEAKTKRPYIIGQAYYQLMKSEKVQPNKNILLVEKGKKAIWGGNAARDLIGLPIGEHAKVIPGNHANYDIYVQSTSVNRKLPRGTKVLIDVKQTVAMQPTWTA